MTVRLIDASRFGEILEQWKKDCLEDNDTQGADIISDVILQLDDMPTITPPNEPLTLDQLREMDGEPAYLKVVDPLLESGWHIIKAVTEDKIIFRGWQTVYVPIDGMGIDYNLYRRPPEGEEDT